MKVTRRRTRGPDLFGSQSWVRSIFTRLINAFPMLASLKEKDLVKLVRSVRHVERYSATDTRRGRPSRWPREDLVKVGSKLAEILDRETSGRISLSTFADHYLRLIDFPADVLESLAKGDVNLFEAEQLARVKASRLDISQSEARRRRTEILSAHLRTRSSGERLRRRINEMLAPPEPGISSSTGAGVAEKDYADLEDFDPYDSTHLLWEQIKQLGFAFRDIHREDVSDEDIEQLLAACDPVWNILLRIQQRKQQPARKTLSF